MKYFLSNGKPSPYVKNFFALAMVIGLLGRPMGASADAISFSDTHYYVSAYATNGGTPEHNASAGGISTSGGGAFGCILIPDSRG